MLPAHIWLELELHIFLSACKYWTLAQWPPIVRHMTLLCACRLGILSSMRQGASAKWMKSVAKAGASSAAKRLKENARLKALHRTPYPMVLARMKLLLDRLQVRHW